MHAYHTAFPKGESAHDLDQCARQRMGLARVCAWVRTAAHAHGSASRREADKRAHQELQSRSDHVRVAASCNGIENRLPIFLMQMSAHLTKARRAPPAEASVGAKARRTTQASRASRMSGSRRTRAPRDECRTGPCDPIQRMGLTIAVEPALVAVVVLPLLRGGSGQGRRA